MDFAKDIAVDEKGKKLFNMAFKESKDAGKTDEVSYARGYVALQRAGYMQDKKGAWAVNKDATVSDVHVPTADRKLFKQFLDFLKFQKSEEQTESFELQADVIEKNDDKRLVYGWASVIEKSGKDVTDHHGDVIKADDLVEAAHNYISEHRTAKAMHQGSKIGEVVESMVFTDEVQKALGIDLDQVGWFICMKVHDDKVWKDFKKGKYQAFSIGGKGIRQDISDE